MTDRPPYFFLVLTLLALGSWAALVYAAWRASDRRLRLPALVTLSFCARAAIAAALFFVSDYRLDVLPDLQTQPGFWAFARDGQIYQGFAHLRAWSWHNAVPVEVPLRTRGYVNALAFVYFVLGPHPLFGIVLGVVASVACAIVVYRLSLRVSGERGALIPAAVVAFWPSSLIWGGVLLRDAWSWLAALLAFLCVLRFRGRGRVMDLVALFGAVFVFTSLRFYAGGAFVAGIAVLLLHDLVRRRNPRRALVGAAIATAAFVCALQLQTSRSLVEVIAQALPTSSGVFNTLGEFRAETIRNARDVNAQSVVDSATPRGSALEFIQHLPRALMNGLFAPGPGTLLSPEGISGGFKRLAWVEMLLLYVLGSAIAVGLYRVGKRDLGVALLLGVTTVACATAVGFAAPVAGIIFRIRLVYLFPMLTLLGCLAHPFRQPLAEWDGV